MARPQQTDQSQRPKFLPSFLGAVQAEAERQGWWAVFPVLMMLVAIAAALVAYVMPEEYWSTAKRELAVAVYAGMLTFNGLVLALGWTAFSRIYDVLLRGDFGKYLMQNDLLNGYILQITYMHIFQIGAAVISAVGLVSVLIDGIPIWAERLIFGATLAFMMYAIKQAVDAVTAMNDLVWQSAYYETNRPAQGAPSNVAPFRADRP